MFGTIETWEQIDTMTQRREPKHDRLFALLEREGVFDTADRLIEEGIEELPTISLEEAKRRMEIYCGG